MEDPPPLGGKDSELCCCALSQSVKKTKKYGAPAGNRTRGKRMATIYFTTKPLARCSGRNQANINSLEFEKRESQAETIPGVVKGDENSAVRSTGRSGGVGGGCRIGYLFPSGRA